MKGGREMSTYLMFGKYSIDALGKISAARSKSATSLIKDHGGELKAGYALLGDKDLVLVVNFPNPENAMKASVALAKQLGIAFTTTPAVSMEEFDRLVAGK
jgi:uncharacterized protein with GYD domain